MAASIAPEPEAFGLHEAMEPGFEVAGEMFRVLSVPMRLRIISSLCAGEKNVRELLTEIDTTQPNMSQHLTVLYKSGVVGRRRVGVCVYYRIVNEWVVPICMAVCNKLNHGKRRS